MHSTKEHKIKHQFSLQFNHFFLFLFLPRPYDFSLTLESSLPPSLSPFGTCFMCLGLELLFLTLGFLSGEEDPRSCSAAIWLHKKKRWSLRQYVNSRAGYLLLQACQDAVFSFSFPSLLAILFLISLLLLFSPADEGRGVPGMDPRTGWICTRHPHTCTGLFSSEMPRNSVPCPYRPESMNKVQCTCRSKLSSLKSR